jgi:hypothetical protein
MTTLKQIVQDCKDEGMSKAETLAQLPSILTYYVQSGKLVPTSTIADMTRQAVLHYD